MDDIASHIFRELQSRWGTDSSTPSHIIGGDSGGGQSTSSSSWYGPGSSTSNSNNNMHDNATESMMFDVQSENEEDGIGISWWLILILIAGFFAIVLASALLRELCFRCYGIRLCSNPLMANSRLRERQREQERQFQRSNRSSDLFDPSGLMTAEEIREQKVEQQRMDRQVWYQYYLKPYVTVLTAQNFALLGDKKAPEETNNKKNTSYVDLAQIAMCLGGEDEDDEENQCIGMDIEAPAASTEDDNIVVEPAMPTIDEACDYHHEQHQEETEASPCEHISRDFVALQAEMLNGGADGDDDQEPQPATNTMEDVDLEAQQTTTATTEAQTGNQQEEAATTTTTISEAPPTPTSPVKRGHHRRISSGTTMSEAPPTPTTPVKPKCGHHRRISSIPCPLMEIWDPHENAYRRLEANCAICLNDYEVGDSIVRSATDDDGEYCKHIYHFDCMLLWLSQGKKRCPMCRHWFVPALRIKEQMKIARITQSTSRHHLLDAGNNGVSSSVAETDSNMSHSIADSDPRHSRENSAEAMPDHP